MSRCECCGAPAARSLPQLKRFHAVVQAAFTQWPERDRFKPTNKEHLRAYLLCEVGWRHEVSVEIRDKEMANAGAIIAKSLLRGTGHYCWIVAERGTLTLYEPRSISFSKARHKAICTVFEDVEGIIADRLGIKDCDQLLKETERAA